MADRYDRSIRVPQSVIDDIKKMGMTEAIKRARAGEGGREFLEGAKRMYGGNRVGYNKVSEAKTKKDSSPDSSTSEKKTETKPASSTKPKPEPPPKAAVERRLSSKPPPGLSRRNVAQIKSAAEPIAKRLKTSGNVSKASRSHAADFWGDVGKNLGEKLGLNNPFRPRKRK